MVTAPSSTRLISTDFSYKIKLCDEKIKSSFAEPQISFRLERNGRHRYTQKPDLTINTLNMTMGQKLIQIKINRSQ